MTQTPPPPPADNYRNGETASHEINSLPGDKCLAMTTFKPFADDKTKVAKITISVGDTVENIAGNGKKKCCLTVFSPFPSMFSTCFFLMTV